MNTHTVRVKVVIYDTIAVHANTMKEAKNVASLCMLERLSYQQSGAADKERDDGVAVASAETVSSPAYPDDRLDTYVCSGCGQPSPKTAFGPGWQTCPMCGAPPLPVNAALEL